MSQIPVNRGHNQRNKVHSKRARHFTVSNAAIATVISVLVHLVLLSIIAPKLSSFNKPIVKSAPLEISFELRPDPVLVEPPMPPSPLPKQVVPQQPVHKAISQPIKPHVAKSRTVLSPVVEPHVAQTSIVPEIVTEPLSAVPVMTVPAPEPEVVLPVKTPQTTPAQATATASNDEPLPGEDMQDYLNRKRGKSENINSKRDDVIKNNLQFGGTNGVFEIKHMGLNDAQFTFRGWKRSATNSHTELIEVYSEDPNDLQRAIIRKMIVIIRREYSGDFNWRSERLGRMIQLSARPQDNDGLEDFMMKEFF